MVLVNRSQSSSGDTDVEDRLGKQWEGEVRQVDRVALRRIHYYV